MSAPCLARMITSLAESRCLAFSLASQPVDRLVGVGEVLHETNASCHLAVAIAVAASEHLERAETAGGRAH